MAAAMVLHRSADVFWNRSEVTKQLLDRFILQRRVFFHRFVKLCNIYCMMLIVVDLQRTRIEVRLERIKRVEEFW